LSEPTTASTSAQVRVIDAYSSAVHLNITRDVIDLLLPVGHPAG